MPRLYVFFQGTLTQLLRRDDRGTTAVEYALIATLIAVVIVAVVASIGTELNTMFTNVANAL
jgi:pilus assembly protein Flp/PilA